MLGNDVRDRADQNLHIAVPPQTETAAAHVKQTRAARLEHAQPAAGAHAHFRHPANQAHFAGDLGHFRPFPGSQKIQGEQ
jgi:hypothetical protein